jgi:hypothetical protein
MFGSMGPSMNTSSLVVDSNHGRDMSDSVALVENGEKPGQDSPYYFIFRVLNCTEIPGLYGIQRVNKIIGLKGELLLQDFRRQNVSHIWRL